MNFSQLFCRRSMFVLTLLVSIGWSLDVRAGTLRLKWTDVSDNESGFKIERMSSSGDYVLIANVPANAQTYTDTGLTAGSTYCYRVRAFNAKGTSSPSNVGCTTALSISGSFSVSTPKGSSTVLPRVSTETLNLHSNSSVRSKWSNYRVTMNIQSSGIGRTGIMFRYQDRDNYYRFSSAAGSHRLEKRIAGAFKLLAQTKAIYSKARQTYTVQIISQGTTLKVMVDGKAIFSVIDSTFSAGTIALYSWRNSGSAFDDVVVEDLPSGKILLSDTFSDSGHVGWTIVDEEGQAEASRWSVATGALVQSSDVSGTFALFTRGSWQDYRLTLKLSATGDDPITALFRFQDTDNYYLFSWGRGSSGRRLVKRENGADLVIAQDAVPRIAAKNHRLEIAAHGSSLKVKIDAETVFSVIDKSFEAGTIGLFPYATKGIDEVIVEELPSTAELLWEDFTNGTYNGWTIFDQPGQSERTTGWSALGEPVRSGNTITFLVY